MKNNRAIYALYANDKFVSWLYGAFCQLTAQPKLYWCGENHAKQSAVVLENLKAKIERINRPSAFGAMLGLDESNPIDKGENADSAILSNLSNFKLGVFFVHEDDVNKRLLEELSQTQPEVSFEVGV